MFSDNLLYRAAVMIVPIIIAIVFHEVAHGWVARFFGDPTAHESRRLSFNPVRHIDPLGTIILPGMLALAGAPVFGWAKPVPVSKWRLNNPRLHMMLVALAGPGMNILLATFSVIMLSAMTYLAGGWNNMGLVATFITDMLVVFVWVNVVLAIFNMLPIPPFDGSHVVEGLLPPKAARQYVRLRPIGMLLVLVLIVALPYAFPDLHLLERIILPPVQWIIGGLFSLVGLPGFV